jgi:hypothetical protein
MPLSATIEIKPAGAVVRASPVPCAKSEEDYSVVEIACRRMIAGIQFADRRDNLVSITSPSKSWSTGTDVKRPRSLKQFTLTTARVPPAISATAAMKAPQRRQIRKSQVRVPKR